MRISLVSYTKLLARDLKPHLRLAVVLGILLAASIGLQLANPQIIRYFIDAAQAGAAISRLMQAAALFFVFALIQQAFSILAAYVSENLAWKTTNALRLDLAEHCLGLDLSFHNTHNPGELIERLDGDVTALSNFFSQFVHQLGGNSLLLLGILVMLFLENFWVGLGLSSFTALTIAIMLRLRNIAVPYWTAERQASADLFGFLEERMAGAEDIRSNGAEAYVMRQFYIFMQKVLQSTRRAAMMVNFIMNMMIFLFTLGTATAFAIGAFLFLHNTITIGSVYVIFYYTTMLERPINAIVRQIEDLQKAGAGIVRIQQLFAFQSKIQERPVNLKSLPSGGKALAVTFRGVTFGYDDGPEAGQKEYVLKDLSFQIQPGRVLGLLGRTGSGKTTLTRLLFRLYDPDSGEIAIQPIHSSEGNLDIRDLPIHALRGQVGMVTQTIQLFNASVRDNLTFFDRDILDEKILCGIEELGLGKWFRTLPQGLDSMLASGGGGLSAGEAQLLAFVRVFLKDPGLVVLDEASSRLDPASEALVGQAVRRLVEGRTAIIIAHHLSTVQQADEIMILENGSIVEYAPRQQLANDPKSHFSQLLQTGLEEVLV